MTSRTSRVAGLIALALIVLAPVARTDDKSGTKPIAFDDFIRIQRVSDLQLSPDGASIAFVVTVMDKAANRGTSDIWIVPARGGEPRRLTSSPASDMNPRWSPDGRTIAFISDRSGTEEIWLMNQDGTGEPRQLTTGGDTYKYQIRWSPDGSKILWNDKMQRLFYVGDVSQAGQIAIVVQ